MDTKRGWAVVTGASAGLGVEFARQLARRGYDIVLTARRRDRLDALARELEKSPGTKTLVVESDLAVAGASVALVASLDAAGVDPEVLVNNAGFGYHGPALDASVAKMAEMVQLNITAVTELALLLGAKMAARGKGSIVNVSSTGSFQPVPYMSVYGATKAYVTSFSLALARELGPRGVRVLAHCPGPTRTEFNDVANVHVAQPQWVYMSAERCVAIALRALEGGRWVVVTGLLNAIAAYFARRSPLWLVTRVTGWVFRPLPGK